MEACTVTAPWCDHCFRSSKPQLNLAEQLDFSGLVAQQVALPSWSPSLLRAGKVLFKPTLSTVDAAKVKWIIDICQCRFSVQLQILLAHLVTTVIY